MAKINDIQRAILQLEGGRYQKMMECYLVQKYNFPNFTPSGSETGTDKTTKGIPDAYVRTSSGRYIFIMFGTTKSQAYSKICKDIQDCLSEEKTGIPVSLIEKIICCHTSSNISAKQNAQIFKLFESLELIGIGELSYDIYIRFHQIASEFLSIPVDTNQILSPAAFVDESKRNEYGTPLDSPCDFRDNDILGIFGLLQTNIAVYISGASGIGKTRLAIEVAKKYCEGSNYIISIIKSNGLQIYEDIRSLIYDEKHHFIIVDDANQLTELKYLFQICSQLNVTSRVRILLTVRDYAKQEVIQQAYGNLTLVGYPLKTLTDKQITEIIEKHFEINNKDYQEQIVRIAKGNIRIAIIAAMRAKEGNIGVILNIAQIFQWFFKPIWEKMDVKELQTAILVAFFETVILNDSNLASDVLEAFGLSREVFVEKCLDLHNKEIVSVFRDLAVRFEQQNFRDYLLYYAFIEKRKPCIADCIVLFYPKYKEQIVYALNTLLNLFYEESNLQYIRSEIHSAWQQLQLIDDETVKLDYVKSFARLLDAQALVFVKGAILSLSRDEEDFFNYNHKDNKTGVGLRKDLLDIISVFKHSEIQSDAFHLFFDMLKYSSKNPDDYIHLLKDQFSPDSISHKFLYSSELAFIDELTALYKETKTSNIAFCLLYFAECCLRTSFSSTESSGRNVITIKTFGYLVCEESILLRRKCFEAYDLLLAEGYEKYVLKSLQKYTDQADSEKKILKEDSKFVTEFCTRNLNNKNINHCIILYKLREFFVRNKVEYDHILLGYKENKEFALLAMMIRDRFHDGMSWEDAEKIRKQQLSNLVLAMTYKDFEQFFLSLSNDFLHDKGTWELQSGISDLFRALEATPDIYFAVLANYLQNNSNIEGISRGAAQYLMSQMGYKKARTFLETFAFDGKANFLSYIDDAIPDDLIDQAFCVEMLRLANSQLSSVLSYDTVTRISKKFPGYLVQYTNLLLQKYSEQPYVIEGFLDFRMHTYGSDCTEMVSDYEDSILCLENAYLIASRSNHFDYRGHLMLAILKVDPNFISVYFSSVSSLTYMQTEHLSYLWNSHNYVEIIEKAVDATRPMFIFSAPAHSLFKANNDQEISTRQTRWLKHYVDRYCNDVIRMEIIFGLLDEYPLQLKKELILYFCTRNQSFEVFKKLEIHRWSESWSGSEMPIIDAKIEYFRELLTGLSGIPGTFEHKAFIIEKINGQVRYKEQVLYRDFIEGRAQV